MKDNNHNSHLWIFGYGSLMWRPDFEYIEKRVATLYGFHRALCIYSFNYRGTEQKPGLVFGLDRGGSCKGIVFRIRNTDQEKIFAQLHKREMPTKVYLPTWLKVQVEKNVIVAYGFVADRNHKQYATKLTEQQIISLVHQGYGSVGSCLDYVDKTLNHLMECGINEKKLNKMINKVKNR
jgi:glutathione-specific gamma-glutamylcyclotransferase